MRKYQRQWKLEEVREINNNTQEELATLLNINTTSYRNKEKGITEFKSSEMFLIAKKYNKNIEDIFLPTTYTNREHNKQKA